MRSDRLRYVVATVGQIVFLRKIANDARNGRIMHMAHRWKEVMRNVVVKTTISEIDQFIFGSKIIC